MVATRSLTTKRMASGKYIDLADLRVSDIDIYDINTALNHIYRFTGHYNYSEPLTVAQHTVLVMHLARQIFPNDTVTEFNCLLHDMPEAYYGDIATPLKNMFGGAVKQYMNSVDTVVYTKLWKLNEPFTEEIEQKTKICDLLALDIERRAMWRSHNGKDQWPDIPMERFFSSQEKLELFRMIQSNKSYDLITMYDGF